MSENQDTPLATDPIIYDRMKANPDAVRALVENSKTYGLMTPDAAEKHVERTWAPVLKRYDLTNNEANSLAALDGMAHQKPPAAEQRAAWASDAKAALLATYGPNGVGQALKDAKAFIAQDPQLHKFASKGFGDHRSLVLLAARLGSEARKSGRLK